MFRDQLLVRSGNEMVPTRRAIELSNDLTDTLRRIREIVDSGERFEPSEFDGTISIAATEGATIAVLGDVLSKIATVAPRIRIRLSNDVEDAYVRMRSGDIDMLVDTAPSSLPADFRQHSLLSNGLVCVTSTAAGRGDLTHRDYSELSHAIISGGTNDDISRQLLLRGVNRRVMWEFPGLISAASIVSCTNLVLTVPEALGLKAEPLFPLTVFPMPISVPPVTLTLVWHARHQGDRAQSWLRDQIVAGIIR